MDADCTNADLGWTVFAVTVWRRSTKSVGSGFWPCFFDLCFLGALSPFFPLPSGMPWFAAWENLGFSLFLVYQAKNFQRMDFFSATATVWEQIDSRSYCGQPRHLTSPLASGMTMCGLAGSWALATANPDWKPGQGTMESSGELNKSTALVQISLSSSKGTALLMPLSVAETEMRAWLGWLSSAAGRIL